MLHCPRCLGPLQVKEEAPTAATSKPSHQEHHPRLPPLPSAAVTPAMSPASASEPSSRCPSGHLCPYEQSALLAAATSPSKARSSVYMSGGGVVLPPTSQEPQPQRQQLPHESHQQQQQQEMFRPVPPPPPRLDVFAAQAQQQQQQLFGLHPLQQHQLQHQQHHLLCQQQHPQVISAPQLQPQFAVLGGGCAVSTAAANQQFPLFLTSTIPAAMTTASGLVSSVSLSQPPTPAIVVGSAGNPFFPPPTRPASLPLPSAAAAAAVPVISQPQFVSLIPHAVPAPVAPIPPVAAPSPAAVKEILRVNRERLEECGWYYPTLTWNESAQLLRDAAPGTFLVRDSSDDRFLFSLSVQRSGKEGPTSVRIHFQRGKFKLDAEEDILHLMPEFPSVLDLIDHYLLPPGGAMSKEEQAVAKAAQAATQRGKTPVWLDANGQQSSEIRLRRPLCQNVPSLAHSARLSVNRRLGGRGHGGEAREAAVKTLGVPAKLEKYLVDYPNRV